MSLIDEALKRARQEAAQQDAARRGAAQPWIPMPLPPVRERRSLAPALAGIALGLLLVAGLAVWLLHRPAPAASATPPASAPAVAVKPPASAQAPLPATAEQAPERPPPGTRETAREPAPAPRAARTERAPVTEPALSSPPGRRETAADQAGEHETAPGPKPADQPRAPHPAEPAATPEDGKSYPGAVALPNGHKLELRGIAYSDTQPVVLINGKLLSPGEGIEGYTVVAIKPQRVELKGASGTLYLTLQ